MPTETTKPTNPAWAGYAFAVAVTGAMFVFRFEVNHLIGDTVSLPLCALAAVFTCLWCAGLRPALLATVLTAAWYIWDFQKQNPPVISASIHYALYVFEAGMLCLFGRQLRAARDLAAKGEDWQRHLVQTAGEGIWTVDPDGVIGYANPRMAEILGCAVEQITGRKVDAFLFPEDIPVERIRFQNRRAGVKEQYDRRLRRADGYELWTLACSSPYSYRGKDTGVLTMMTDITERKKAEQALRHSERKFRELFENIREGVYQTSPDGRILAANPELLRMLDFSDQEELNVVGVVRDTFVDADLHQSLRDRLERDGSYANVEFQLRTRDHRIVTVRENARVVRDENGDVLYYEGTLTDVTERIRVEKQLRRAQEMEALGRLAGGIARDLRHIGGDMLSGLRQAIGLLPPDSPAQPSLDAVERSVHNAEALTRQILDFSRRETSDRKGHTEGGSAIDVNALIVGLGPELCRLVSPDNCLEVSLCDNPTPVLADPDHIQQIVTSFIIHARGFGTGAKQIDLTTAIATDGHFVALSVLGRTAPAPAHTANNGEAGVQTSVQPWIGMATSQAILAQYGGRMTATVEPPAADFGSGVRYALYLPLASGERLSVPSLAGFGATTVLLVEEEPLTRELNRDMLERHGFRVLTASNASEAEGLARGQQTFDVLMAPWAADGRGSAPGFVHVLRGMRPNLRVLLIGDDPDGSLGSIPPRDGAPVLMKPFSGDSLGRAIHQLLNGSRATGT